MSETQSDEAVAHLKNALKRCSAETIEAAIQFRTSRDPRLISTIVYGVIERYLSAPPAKPLSEMSPDTKLIEDLGVDSLTMLEIVMDIEESLTVKIENDALRTIRTLGDVKTFLEEQIAKKPEEDAADAATSKSRKMGLDEIAAILPQQMPFLFINSAELSGDVVRASYQVSGEEYFLEGHFKGDPVFPASIIFEALGQAACLHLLVSQSPSESVGYKGKIYFGSMEGGHFFRPARPGDLLEFELKMTRFHAPIAVYEGACSCGGKKVCRVEGLTLVMGDGILEPDQADKSAV